MLNSVAEARAARNLGHRALSLGAAGAFEYATQFLLPVVLVRCLDAAAFGQYRLLWLIAGTVMAFVPMAMQSSLYYFFPRSDATQKRLYVNQTVLFFAALGVLAAWAVSDWNPWRPEAMKALAIHPALVPAFVLLWVVSSVLDLLPTIEEHVTWQAKTTVGLALARAVTLSVAAAVTGEFIAVMFALLAFVLLKVGLLLRYIYSHHGLRPPFLRWPALIDQLKFTAPFWIGGLLYGLRAQADQWVAASLFPLAMFASFSVAGVLGPFVHLCRQSVANAFMPSMSRLQAEGGIAGMLELNSRANVLVASLVFPLLALAFAFAEDVVTVVYTEAYAAAAPVMRVFILGFAALVVELAGITLLLRLGTFMVWVNLVALAVAVALNWVCAIHFGLAGAAAGTVVVIYLDRLVTMLRIARQASVSIGRLQNWNMLAALAAISVVSAAFSWFTVDRFLHAQASIVRVLAGGLLLVLSYAGMRACLGLDRDLFRTIRGLLQRS